MNGTLAVAAQGETVGHIPTTILTEIKSVLSLVRVLGVTIRNNHLRKGESPEDRADIALVVECDIVQYDTLAVIKSNVDIPVLPVNTSAIYLEGNSLWLGNVDRLDIGAVAALLLNGLGVIVIGSCLVHRSPYWRNINVYDPLLL
jgi:hypothetical protein